MLIGRTTRRRPRRAAVTGLALAAALLAACGGDDRASAGGGTADRVYVSGTVRTVDANGSVAEAVAIEDGRLTAVGSDAEALAEAGPGTEVVDLAGRTIVPGFHDPHLHAVEAGRTAERCFLPPNLGGRAYGRRLRRCARQQRGEGWVRGAGPFVQDMLALPGGPRRLFDRAVPNRPVLVIDALGHAAYANTEALSRAGLLSGRDDPAGGAALRDRRGRPNGVLLENAQNLALDAAERPSRHNLRADRRALRGAVAELTEHGITTVSDAGGYWPRGHHRAWTQLARRRGLAVRASNALWLYPNRPLGRQLRRMAGIRRRAARPGLDFDQVKIYVDGIADYGTAALADPYVRRPGWAPGGRRGFTYFSRRRLDRAVALAVRRGFQAHLHVWGDRAARMALDAIERAQRRWGEPEKPHRITHGYLIDEADRDRLAELGVAADLQLGEGAIDPGYAGFLERRLIGGRAAELLPVGSLLAAGALVTLSSDWDADELGPLAAIERGLTRAGSAERIPDAATGLRMVTINGATLLGQEAETGSLEVGKRADLVVLDADPLAGPIDRIGEIGVLETVLGGETVYGTAG